MDQGPQTPPPTDGTPANDPYAGTPLEDLYADTGATEEERARPDWSTRYGQPPPPPPRTALDFSAFFVLLDVLRRAAPAELQERLTNLIREALLTLRSLIDWYLERLERPSREPEVEDIPID